MLVGRITQLDRIEKKLDELLALGRTRVVTIDNCLPVIQAKAGEADPMPANEDYVLDPSGDYSLDDGQTWNRRH